MQTSGLIYFSVARVIKAVRSDYKGFTDVLFCYSDSGDFSICFNSKKYNPIKVRNIINKIFLEEFV